MAKEKLVYNKEHILEIAERYKKASDLIDSMIQDLSYIPGAKDSFATNYTGQASDIGSELFDKIREHLEFLKSCCDSTSEYVKDSLDTMRTLDKNLLSKVKEIVRI